MSDSTAIGTNTAIVLLAAGSSTRMGQPKQLMPWQGKPLLRFAVETAISANIGPVIVVLGSQSDVIGEALDGLAVRIAQNPDWAAGMGSSIRVGVNEAIGMDADGLILTLGDLPLISAAILKQLAETRERTGQPIVASEYGGTVGVPVYFARSVFAGLLALKPEQGCKGLILANSERAARIACPEAEIDIDTPGDYQKSISAYPA